MRIRIPELVEDSREVRMSALVEFQQRQEHVWYSVDRQYADFLTPERQDAFLVGLLPLAMENGEDITLDGAVSERLFYHLAHYYMRVMSIRIPRMRPVKILPGNVVAERVVGARAGVVTGFSGGIDSFCVLADHLFREVPPGFRLTHLVFNNVGSHGQGQGGRAMFRRRYERLVPLARELGLPYIAIDSNLPEILDSDFERTSTTRNVAAVLAMQRLFGKYLYASTERYEDCHVRPPRPLPWPEVGIAISDPIALPLLSTETTECISTGCQYARTEKTRRVSEIPYSYKYLDVCVTDIVDGNCSACTKCARTLFTLELLGKLPLYEKVFDLTRYRQARRRYLLEVLTSRHFLLKEIRELAEERRFRFPLSLRLAALFHKVANWLHPHIPAPLRRAAKRLLRRSPRIDKP